MPGDAFWRRSAAAIDSLDDLTDVDTSTVAPTDGQALVYNVVSGLWVPGTVSGGAPAAAAVRAYRNTTNQPANTGTDTPVQFNAETFDDSGYHDNVTNNTRFTIPAGGDGRFRITGQIQYGASSTGERRAMLYVNGVTLVAIETKLASSGVSGTRVQVSSGLLPLAAGDYVQLVAYQTSAGSLDIAAGSGATWLSMEKA